MLLNKEKNFKEEMDSYLKYGWEIEKINNSECILVGSGENKKKIKLEEQLNVKFPLPILWLSSSNLLDGEDDEHSIHFVLNEKHFKLVYYVTWKEAGIYLDPKFSCNGMKLNILNCNQYIDCSNKEMLRIILTIKDNAINVIKEMPKYRLIVKTGSVIEYVSPVMVRIENSLNEIE
jgi:hypothetical protein